MNNPAPPLPKVTATNAELTRKGANVIQAVIPAMQVGIVLQVAFARLVARRAVQRVIDQVHLENVLARLDNLWRVRQHFHVFGERSGTGLDQTATFAENLDGANPARSPRAQQRLVA